MTDVREVYPLVRAADRFITAARVVMVRGIAVGWDNAVDVLTREPGWDQAVVDTAWRSFWMAQDHAVQQRIYPEPEVFSGVHDLPIAEIAHAFVLTSARAQLTRGGEYVCVSS